MTPSLITSCQLSPISPISFLKRFKANWQSTFRRTNKETCDINMGCNCTSELINAALSKEKDIQPAFLDSDDLCV